MRVVESFSAGKTGDDGLNEDLIVVTPGFVAVLDGVTTKTCPAIDGVSGGRRAVQLGAAMIAGFDAGVTAVQAVARLTQALRDLAREHGIAGETPAFVMAIYSRARREVWTVGDAPVMIDGTVLAADKQIDRVTAQARALMIEIALRQGKTVADIMADDVGRAYTLPLLSAQHLFANRPGRFGFGVVNGTDVPEQFITVHDASRAREIVLASDGYPSLLPTLAESEAALARLLRDDPLLCRDIVSTKGLRAGNASFDDRSYIRFIPETG